MSSKLLDVYEKRQKILDKIHQTEMKYIEYINQLQYLRSKLESIDSYIAETEASATIGQTTEEAAKRPLRDETIGPIWEWKAEKHSWDRHIHPRHIHTNNSNSNLKPVKTTGEAATYSEVESIEVRLRNIKF